MSTLATSLAASIVSLAASIVSLAANVVSLATSIVSLGSAGTLDSIQQCQVLGAAGVGDADVGAGSVLADGGLVCGAGRVVAQQAGALGLSRVAVSLGRVAVAPRALAVSMCRASYEGQVGVRQGANWQGQMRQCASGVGAYDDMRESDKSRALVRRFFLYVDGMCDKALNVLQKGQDAVEGRCEILVTDVEGVAQ